MFHFHVSSTESVVVGTPADGGTPMVGLHVGRDPPAVTDGAATEPRARKPAPPNYWGEFAV